ncbi:tRNA lysidine(34) synthetase TilS [Immundisolibacter sp.]|uniref:tRNA lysidine(34) synthetase TilS n=1 Tax=Immundisolibacter sp. TaxID=1934948 RepID=UPI003F836F8E
MIADAGLQTLRAALPAGGQPVTVHVAYSGGRDSHVLLHWLAERRARLAPHRLGALHVDHGLQPQAAGWATHCHRVCAGLDVPLEVVAVDARPTSGESPEAAARAARYRAFAARLAAGDLLLTAHHQADQAETVLLALLRGAGPAGTAAMPPRRRLGAGWLVRPLLDWPAARLAAYAAEHGLDWVDDPSNRDTRYDRNFLRHAVLPQLAGHWPDAAAALARHAVHAGEAQALLDDLAAVDGCTETTLAVSRLTPLSPARQRNLLRGWLRWHGAPVPSQRRLEELLRQALVAGADRQPCLELGAHAVRAWRGRLYLTPQPLPPAPAPQRWHLAEPLHLPGGGRLWATPAVGDGIAADRLGAPPCIEVRFRDSAGAPVGLKQRLQRSGLPPWWRGQVPLLFGGGRLLQVAGQAPLESARPGQGGWCVHWTPPADAVSVQAR